MFAGDYCQDDLSTREDREDVSLIDLSKERISRKVVQVIAVARNIGNNIGLFVCLILVLPIVKWGDRSRRFGYLLLKSILDKVTALLALIVLSPLFVLVAIAIKMESPGPIFFKQERYGERTLPFKIFKFRTMRLDDKHSH